jgi:uncharacterized membrane protein YfcA
VTLQSLSLLAVVWCSAALFLGGLSKGALGIGLPLLAIPILSLFMSVPQAVVLLTMPIMVTNVWQAVQGGNLRLVLRQFGPMALALVAGLALGTQMLVLLSERWLYVIMGLLVLTQPALRWARPGFNVPERTRSRVGPAVAFFSGLLGGTTGLFGPLVMAYLAVLWLDKDVFTAAVAMLFAAGGVALALFLARVGVMRGPELVISTLALLPAAAGILVGQRVRSRISQSQFEKALPAVMVVVGLSMLYKAL